MSSGIVKWFSPDRGYGFLVPNEAGPDVFVHISEVQRAGLDILRQGDRVEYELRAGSRGKDNAVRLRLPEDEAA